MKRIFLALAVAVVLSGCERLNNAGSTVTDDSKEVGSDSQSNPESGLPRAPMPAAQNDETPFTIEMELNAFSGSLQITSVVDRLTINSIEANRGNCKVQEVSEVVELSDLEDHELAVEVVDDSGNCPWSFRVMETGYVFETCHSRFTNLPDIENELRELGVLMPGMSPVYKNDFGKFRVLRSAFPVSIKFAEKFNIPLECSAENVIEMTIDTDHGAFMWRR